MSIFNPSPYSHCLECQRVRTALALAATTLVLSISLMIVYLP